MPAAVAAATLVPLTAGMARLFGGTRGSAILAAIAVAISPALIGLTGTALSGQDQFYFWGRRGFDGGVTLHINSDPERWRHFCEDSTSWRPSAHPSDALRKQPADFHLPRPACRPCGSLAAVQASAIGEVCVSGDDTVASADALRRGVTRLARQLRRRRSDHGVSAAKLSVLGQLYRAGRDVTAVHLAQWERLQPQSLTRIIADLDERGPVARRQDANDRRQVLIGMAARCCARMRGGRHAGWRERWRAG